MKQIIPGVNGIVFSYNRAMQLDATLRSFFLHCQDAQLVRLTVLYKADHPYHAQQYKTLIEEYPQVMFIAEKNFRHETLKIVTTGSIRPFVRLSLLGFSYLNNTRFLRMPIIRSAISRLAGKMRMNLASEERHRSNSPFTLFLVDDNIFVADFSINEVIKSLESHPDALGFSLRLGRNTTYCYTKDMDQVRPSFTQQSGKVLSYAWPGADNNFGYPLEVSSSVYPTHLIAPLISTLQFHQPNKLESQMAGCSGLFNKTYPLLLCFETSVTFCNPVNIVQHFYSNRAGQSVAFKVGDLAKRFENGERIDVKVLDGFVPNACHQEVEFTFM